MRKLVFLLLITASILVSCKKNEKQSLFFPKDRLQSIQLNDTLNMYVSETRQLPIILTPADYHLDSLKWKSSDTTVITISTSGLLTAKKAGTSTVSVSNLSGAISASTQVMVLPVVPVDSLKLGLIAYYPFNNSAVDASGNGNDGVATNVVATTDRLGNSNAAYYFKNDGVSDSSWVTVKDKPSLRLSGTDFTINTWVKITQYSTSYEDIIIDKKTHLSDSCWILGMTGPKQFYRSINSYGILFYAVSDEGGVPILASKMQIDSSKWHMITIRYTISNHQTSMYIDGILNNSASNVPMPGANNNADIYIGKDNPLDSGGDNFIGKINDIRIYTRAISLNQITQLYNAPN